jgi:glycosyltransferase involved in cell wall biosynthesis
VVANNDPLRREIVGNAGSFVDPQDTAQFSAAIDRALKTEWDHRPTDQAAKFSWDKIAVSYSELFKNLS